jgi:hypothetical protein
MKFGRWKEQIYTEDSLVMLTFCDYVGAVAYQGGWFAGFNPPRNFEVLTKLSRIPNSVENTT